MGRELGCPRRRLGANTSIDGIPDKTFASDNLHGPVGLGQGAMSKLRCFRARGIVTAPNPHIEHRSDVVSMSRVSTIRRVRWALGRGITYQSAGQTESNEVVSLHEVEHLRVAQRPRPYLSRVSSNWPRVIAGFLANRTPKLGIPVL